MLNSCSLPQINYELCALFVIVEQNNKKLKLMSDPIKISIGSIYQYVFLLQRPIICPVHMANWLTIALLGSLSPEVPRMTQFGKTYKLASLEKP